MFAHFTGAQRLPGKAEGNITFSGSITAGSGSFRWPTARPASAPCARRNIIKSRKTDVTNFFMDTIALSPDLAERLADAKMVTAVTATGNYSYNAPHMTGENFIMVGDAFAFIDPVFSTGVYLAMNSAFLAADAVSTCLHEPAKSRACL